MSGGPTPLPPAIIAAMTTCAQKQDALLNQLAAQSNKLPIPPIIYQYTDATGLRGILDSGKIWLSDIFYMNDPSELRHGIGLGVDELRKAAATTPLLGLFASTFDEFRETGLEKIGTFMIACFSGTSEDLGQWRAYADNGAGFALGFDSAMLDTAFMEDSDSANCGPSTFRITYNDAKLIGILSTLVQSVVPVVTTAAGAGLSGAQMHAFLVQMSIALSNDFVSASILFKHPAYHSEDEIRYLRAYGTNRTIQNLKHRIKPMSLIRYTEFDWKTKASAALREIVIGPAADYALASRFVNDCLRAYNLTPPVKMTRSTIPYRSGR